MSFKKKINGHNETVKVLKNITFDIRAREVVGLVGESGCGKSTLAKTLIGLQIPDSGEVIQKYNHPQMIFQDSAASLNPARKVGWILEEPLKNKKVEKNIDFTGPQLSVSKFLSNANIIALRTYSIGKTFKLIMLLLYI